MSRTVEFKDYSQAWLAVEAQNLTNALEAMADAIMKNAKVKAPKLTGKLQYSSHINRINPTTREVVFDAKTEDGSKSYAWYQERGYTSGPVTHYTTPGTQAHYLQTSGDAITQQGIGVYKK